MLPLTGAYAVGRRGIDPRTDGLRGRSPEAFIVFDILRRARVESCRVQATAVRRILAVLACALHLQRHLDEPATRTVSQSS